MRAGWLCLFVAGCGAKSGLSLADDVSDAAVDSHLGGFDVGPAQPSEPRSLALGQQHACALSEGAVWCWGANGNGELGDGTTAWRSTAGRVAAFGGGERVIDLASGPAFDVVPPDDPGPTRGSHTCAVLSDGSVWCWGANLFGLRDGTTADYPWSRRYVAPTRIDGLPRALQAAVSTYHTCVLAADGGVWCWGLQMASGVASPYWLRSPLRVANVEGALQIVVGRDFTCARLADGTVWCWGANDLGALGDGTTSSRPTAARVKDLSGVVELAAGHGHVCARTANGAVLCWGPVGTFTEHLVPTAISEFVGAVAIDAWCAEFTNGTVRCRSTDDTLRMMPAMKSAIEVAPRSGVQRGCLRRLDGVWCWGSNGSGEVGDGTRKFVPPDLPKRVL